MNLACIDGQEVTGHRRQANTWKCLVFLTLEDMSSVRAGAPSTRCCVEGFAVATVHTEAHKCGIKRVTGSSYQGRLFSPEFLRSDRAGSEAGDTPPFALTSRGECTCALCLTCERTREVASFAAAEMLVWMSTSSYKYHHFKNKSGPGRAFQTDVSGCGA